MSEYKLAIIVQCHKVPEQINCLVRALKHPKIDIFLHVDSKSNIEKDIVVEEHVFILPKEYRVKVEWAQFSQVQATLELLKYARQNGKYSHYCLLSGQDYPLVSAEKLIMLLEQKKEFNFVNFFESLNYVLGKTNNYDKRNEIVYPNWLLNRTKTVKILRRLWVSITGGYNHTHRCFKRKPVNQLKFYFGSSWWCLNEEFVKWLIKYLDDCPQYCEFFKKSSCPDECFFQTLLMASPFNANVEDYLHYVDWSEGCSSPKNLQISDMNNIMASGKLFVRKIDGNFELIKMIDSQK